MTSFQEAQSDEELDIVEEEGPLGSAMKVEWGPRIKGKPSFFRTPVTNLLSQGILKSNEILWGDVSFHRRCLDAHNAVRQQFGCPPLTWSQELADLAREWAVKLVEKGRILYMDIPDTGESICFFKASDSDHLPSGTEVTEMWANERKKFDFNKPRWRTECKNFTQIVWRATTEMGSCRCWLPSKNLVAVVALYRPAGNSNLPGHFRANVSPPVSDLSESSLTSSLDTRLTLNDKSAQSTTVNNVAPTSNPTTTIPREEKTEEKKTKEKKKKKKFFS